jgi:hypothetical protein
MNEMVTPPAPFVAWLSLVLRAARGRYCWREATVNCLFIQWRLSTVMVTYGRAGANLDEASPCLSRHRAKQVFQRRRPFQMLRRVTHLPAYISIPARWGGSIKQTAELFCFKVPPKNPYRHHSCRAAATSAWPSSDRPNHLEQRQGAAGPKCRRSRSALPSRPANLFLAGGEEAEDAGARERRCWRGSLSQNLTAS